jgi:hypothetical protein
MIPMDSDTFQTGTWKPNANYCIEQYGPTNGGCIVHQVVKYRNFDQDKLIEVRNCLMITLQTTDPKSWMPKAFQGCAILAGLYLMTMSLGILTDAVFGGLALVDRLEAAGIVLSAFTIAAYCTHIRELGTRRGDASSSLTAVDDLLLAHKRRTESGWYEAITWEPNDVPSSVRPRA